MREAQDLRAQLFDYAEPQVRDTGRVNDPEGLQFDVVGCEMVEQATTATEQHGHEVDLYLVQLLAVLRGERLRSMGVRSANLTFGITSRLPVTRPQSQAGGNEASNFPDLGRA